jgi:hypothetical protein
MQIDRSFLEDQLQAAIASYAGTLKWKGVEYAASVSEINERDDVAAEGIFNEADAEAVVARGSFGNGPVPSKREVVYLRQDPASEFVAFHIESRVSDTISYTFNLRKL